MSRGGRADRLRRIRLPVDPLRPPHSFPRQTGRRADLRHRCRPYRRTDPRRPLASIQPHLGSPRLAPSNPPATTSKPARLTSANMPKISCISCALTTIPRLWLMPGQDRRIGYGSRAPSTGRAQSSSRTGSEEMALRRFSSLDNSGARRGHGAARAAPFSSAARTPRNLTSSKMSYTAFSAPPIISGHPNVERVSRYPARIGLAALARLRGTAVILAAAGRSAGVTTAMTYEVRVGTSICDSAFRASSKAIAVARFGANGTKIRKMLDGRWVNTIVLIRPIRSDTGTATRKDTAAHTLLQKRIDEAVATER